MKYVWRIISNDIMLACQEISSQEQTWGKFIWIAYAYLAVLSK